MVMYPSTTAATVSMRFSWRCLASWSCVSLWFDDVLQVVEKLRQVGARRPVFRLVERGQRIESEPLHIDDDTPELACDLAVGLLGVGDPLQNLLQVESGLREDVHEHDGVREVSLDVPASQRRPHPGVVVVCERRHAERNAYDCDTGAEHRQDSQVTQDCERGHARGEHPDQNEVESQRHRRDCERPPDGCREILGRCPVELCLCEPALERRELVGAALQRPTEDAVGVPERRGVSGRRDTGRRSVLLVGLAQRPPGSRVGRLRVVGGRTVFTHWSSISDSGDGSYVPARISSSTRSSFRSNRNSVAATSS
jgi:hypothetical protein